MFFYIIKVKKKQLNVPSTCIQVKKIIRFILYLIFWNTFNVKFIKEMSMVFDIFCISVVLVQQFPTACTDCYIIIR